MLELAARLEAVRKKRGLSLREMAQALRASGYSVSHDSIRHYEKGDRTVPAEFVRAVCLTFGIDPQWLLFGEERKRPRAGGAREAERPGGRQAELLAEAAFDVSTVEIVRQAWEAYVEDWVDEGSVRPVIMESWERSRARGVEARRRRVRPRRVAAGELEAREHANIELIAAARPHLRWISASLDTVEHVVYLADRDGIVLAYETNRVELAEAWGLLPGHDWSEGTMGTNGAGTALETGRVTAVIGPEHFLEPFHDCVCLAAPVLGQGGRTIGAIDLTTSVADADPGRLMLVAYAAAAIQYEVTKAGGETAADGGG